MRPVPLPIINNAKTIAAWVVILLRGYESVGVPALSTPHNLTKGTQMAQKLWTDDYRDAQDGFDPMLVDDDMLGRLIVNRDEFALSIFMKRHQGWMIGKALKAFGFSEEKDYVVANTYKAIWDSAPKFDPDKGNFRMFAAGLVRSVIRDLAHKGARNLRLRPWNYQDESTEDVIERFHDESTEPLRQIVADETSKAIDDALTDALMKLPRQQRMAWILGEIEGYKNPHIARVIKVKHPTTVSVYKHKANKSLKRYLSDWGFSV